MQRFPQLKLSRTRNFLLVLTCTVLILSSAFPVSAKSKAKKQRLITQPKFDPSAKKVNLFEAMEEKQIATKVIAKNETTGKILFENKTDQPLTVVLPESFVAVPIHAQFPGNNFPGNLFSGSNNGDNNGNGNNQSQSVGGNFNNNNFGNNNNNFGNNNNNNNPFGPGQGFFSVPPHRIVSVTYQSVCLEHGKRTPTLRTKLKLIPTEQFTKDVNLQELLTLVGDRRVNQKTVQAATWHLSNKMSWKQLANKSIQRLGGFAPQAYFSRAEISNAKKIVEYATEQVKKKVTHKQNSKKVITQKRVSLR